MQFGLALEEQRKRIQEDHYCRNDEHGLNGEAAPVGPEGGRPLPVELGLLLDHDVCGHEQSEHQHRLHCQLEGRIARRLVILGQEEVDEGGEARRDEQKPARDANLGRLLQVKGDQDHGYGHQAVFDDLHVEARAKPPALPTHLHLVAQLEDMLHHELRIEEHEHDEAELILVILVEIVALRAEDDEEGAVEQEVAHEDCEHVGNVLQSQLRVHGQLLNVGLLTDWLQDFSRFDNARSSRCPAAISTIIASVPPAPTAIAIAVSL